MKAQDLREKSVDELNTELLRLRRESNLLYVCKIQAVNLGKYTWLKRCVETSRG